MILGSKSILTPSAARFLRTDMVSSLSVVLVADGCVFKQKEAKKEL